MRAVIRKASAGDSPETARESRALPVVLAIETSCDETAVAVARGPHEIVGSEVASQIDLHRAYGGVVPEAASRQHLRDLMPLIERISVSLNDLDGIAATTGPGLASSLMVGAAAAKGLALGLGKPFFAVNHLEGHLLSPFLGVDPDPFPCVGLIVSGGHTLLVEVEAFRRYRKLGGTLDDAAGEAFDKVAKLLGLPYPGGPQIEVLAREGDPARFDLPRSMIKSDDLNFSFSGLKTAVRYLVEKLDAPRESWLADVCASFQAAVIDVLVSKARRAANGRLLALSGGVGMNQALRAALGPGVLCAAPALCTDNAAMIAAVAARAFAAGCPSPVFEDINPNLSLPWQ